jgi:hypothetical protein
VPKSNESEVSLIEIGVRPSLLNRFERWQKRWRDPMLTGLLIMLVLEVFVNIPLSSANISSSPIFFGAVEFIMIIFAVLVASRNRGAAIAVIISLVAALIAGTLRMENPTKLNMLLGASSSAIFMVTLGTVILGAVFASGRVTHHRIQGAVVVYLIIALVFATLYKILITLIPDALSPAIVGIDRVVVGSRLLYFSLTTLTTAGYGDIVPVHPLARSLANLESVIGQLYPATLLVRIMTLHLREK